MNEQTAGAIRAHTSEGAKNILAAAEMLFASSGFDSVTIEAIAHEAGVSQANVIYHFKSKKELYLAVLRTVRIRISEKLDSVAGGTEDIQVYLTNFANTLMTAFISDDHAMRLFMREVLGYGQVPREELVNKVMGSSFINFIGKLQEAKNAGALRLDVDPVAAAFVLFGTNMMFVRISEVCDQLLEGSFKADTAEFTQKALDILLKGIIDNDRRS